MGVTLSVRSLMGRSGKSGGLSLSLRVPGEGIIRRGLPDSEEADRFVPVERKESAGETLPEREPAEPTERLPRPRPRPRARARVRPGSLLSITTNSAAVEAAEDGGAMSDILDDIFDVCDSDVSILKLCVCDTCGAAIVTVRGRLVDVFVFIVANT